MISPGAKKHKIFFLVCLFIYFLMRYQKLEKSLSSWNKLCFCFGFPFFKKAVFININENL